MSEDFTTKVVLNPFIDEVYDEVGFIADEEETYIPSANLLRGEDGPQGKEEPVSKHTVTPSSRRSTYGWTSAEGAKGILKYAANPTKRIPTGIWPIDNMTGGGVGIGEVCVVVGKSGSGKSYVGQNIMENNLDVPAVFFSFEMPGPMLITRSLAMWSGKTHDEVFNMIEGNKIVPELLDDWEDAHRNHIYVTKTGLDLDAMSQTLREAEEVLGIKPALIVIDYMELVAAVSGSESSTIDNVTSLAQMLKGWAKTEEVATVLLHQTNKSLRHGDAPDDDSARYGGFTEADIVIGVWRPHKWEPKAKGENAMIDVTREYLKGFFGINLIKNRPKVELNEQGYMVPILSSGRLNTPKGKILEKVVPGQGVF